MDWLRTMGFQLDPVPMDDWVKMVEAGQDGCFQRLQKLLQGIFIDGDFKFTQSHFLRTNTDKVLAQLGWNYGSVDESLLHLWVKRLGEKGIVPRPTKDIKMLDGTVCVVTGASEGIGEAITKALAIETGANVVLAARQLSLLEENIRNYCELGTSAERLIAVQCDITRPEDVDNLVKKAIERYGKIDVLVNCAGLMYYSTASKGYTEEWRRQIDVNVHGTSNVIGAILPHMVERRAGHILTITSDAGKRAFAGLAVYSGTKFYLEGFIQALRQEMVQYGIKFTNIQPGDVATRLASRSTDSEARDKYDASESGHKILSAEDVAKSALFALSQPTHVAINELLIEPQAAPI